MRRVELLLFLCITFSASAKAQIDSIVVTHFLHIDYPDTMQLSVADSFSMGIHVSQYKYERNTQPISRTFYNWSQGNLIDSTVENYVNTSWFYWKRRENQFASNDSLILSTLYSFSFNGIDYDTSISRDRITFDTLTNTIMRTNEVLTGTVWNTITRHTEIYDSLNRLTYHLFEYPFPQPSWNYSFHYLPNNSIDYYIYRQYLGGVLNDSDSIVHVYYANGFLWEAITFMPDVNPGWRPNLKVSYTYDSMGIMMSLCNKIWIDSIIGWDCFGDTTAFTYNVNNLLQHEITSYCGLGGGNEVWYFYDAQARPDSIYLATWPHSGNTNHFYWKYEYPLLTSVKEVNEPDEFIFPNPTTKWVRLGLSSRFEMVDVLDLNGQKLITHSSGVSEIDVSDLSQGLFVLRVQFPEGIVRYFRLLVVE